MAKRKRSEAEMPPGAETTATHEVVVEPPPATEETQTVMAKLQRLTVSVPSVDLGMAAGYQSNRVDVQNLTGRQRATLKCVMRGLEEHEAKLANGKTVKGYSDTIKYLLENLE